MKRNVSDSVLVLTLVVTAISIFLTFLVHPERSQNGSGYYNDPEDYALSNKPVNSITGKILKPGLVTLLMFDKDGDSSNPYALLLFFGFLCISIGAIILIAQKKWSGIILMSLITLYYGCCLLYIFEQGGIVGNPSPF